MFLEAEFVGSLQLVTKPYHLDLILHLQGQVSKSLAL